MRRRTEDSNADLLFEELGAFYSCDVAVIANRFKVAKVDRNDGGFAAARTNGDKRIERHALTRSLL